MAEIVATRSGAEMARVWSRDDLAARFAACTERSVILDLTRRGLAPFEAARQITAQIGTTPDALLAELPPILLPDAQGVQATHIGSWIDFELFGDPARILADRIADDAGARDVNRMLVLMPIDPKDLTRADGLLIGRFGRRLLTQGKPVTLAYARACYGAPPELGLGLEGGWSQTGAFQTPRFAPGPMTPAMRAKCAMLGVPMPDGVQAPNGQIYVAPEDRFGPRQPVPEMAAAYARQWGWDGLPHLIATEEAKGLAQYAWRALAARDTDLAAYLARKATDRPGDQSFARTTLATILIIAQSFEELAQIPEGAENLNRAWGETLAGDAARAAVAFQTAPKAENTAMSLYLSNISALADVRIGQIDLAWAKQRKISAALQAMPSPSPHLRFINALNLGRLARADGKADEAARFMTQAFAARGADLSEHDHFYREVLLADVADDPKARAAHWAKAARIFGSQSNPGAISMRAFRKVVGRKPRPFEFREEAVSRALQSHCAQVEHVP